MAVDSRTMSLTPCEQTGHNFQLVSTHSTRVVVSEQVTNHYMTIFCTKCGESKSIRVATQEHYNAPGY